MGLICVGSHFCTYAYGGQCAVPQASHLACWVLILRQALSLARSSRGLFSSVSPVLVLVFMWVLRIEYSSLYLQVKYFTD